MPSIQLSRAYGIVLFPWIEQPHCCIDMSKIGPMQVQLLFEFRDQPGKFRPFLS